MTQQEKTAAENEDHMQLMVSRLHHRLEKIHEGGGKRRMKKHRDKGKNDRPRTRHPHLSIPTRNS